jgi:lipopolysaccharide/colanic/teichoic acid biosynthesis glycosyltransferase
MRRLVDVVGATVLILLLTPVLLAVSLVLVLTMGRPLFFRQYRAGLHGKVFTVCKFRTMHPATFPGQGDEARTPFLGGLLRRLSLDELPQLWNILRGDMSLIGPRPTVPEQADRYTERQRGRLAVRPGLTGWAQVNGRNSIGWPERIELDLWYIENRSARLDARILARTFRMVINGSGVVGVGGINPDLPHEGARAWSA